MIATQCTKPSIGNKAFILFCIFQRIILDNWENVKEKRMTTDMFVNTSRSSPHLLLITGFVTRLTLRVTNGAGTAHPAGVPEFTSVLVGFVLFDLYFYVYVL